MKTVMFAIAALVSGLFVAAVMVTESAPMAAQAAPPQVVLVGTMAAQRAAHQATLLGTGEVLVTGGCGGERCDAIHASVDLYDPVTRSFRPAATMATPRASHMAIALRDGRVLVAGGWTGRSAVTSAEVYDRARGRFTAVGNMIEARISPVAVTLPGGRILITGGEAGLNAPVSSAEVFDPATSTFSTVSPMRTPRMAHAAVRLPDGRVLVAGGPSVRNEILSSAEIFDPATGTFQSTGNMTVPRHKHAAVPMNDGTVLILGGSDSRDFRGRYLSTEIYDPVRGQFSAGPDMRGMRHKIRDAVVVLPSGALIVAGGAARPEIYDLATRRFVAAAGELSGPQMFATATPSCRRGARSRGLRRTHPTVLIRMVGACGIPSPGSSVMPMGAGRPGVSVRRPGRQKESRRLRSCAQCIAATQARTGSTP
jgi:hypothetical protein